MSGELPVQPPLLEAGREAHQGAELPDPDGAFARLAAETVDATPGWRDTLRELPTAARLGLAATVCLGVFLAVVMLTGVRPDMDRDVAARMGVVVAVCGGLGLGALTVALRGMHRPAMGARGWALVALALFLPVAWALVPGFWPGEAAATKSPWTTGCLWGGLATALAAGGFVRLLGRGGGWQRPLAAGGAGGLWACAALAVHCPMNDTLHLVVAHGLLGIAVGSLFLLVAARR